MHFIQRPAGVTTLVPLDLTRYLLLHEVSHGPVAPFGPVPTGTIYARSLHSTSGPSRTYNNLVSYVRINSTT